MYTVETKQSDADGVKQKIDRIVALAERLYPTFGYADRAYDAVRQDPNCNEQEVADRLAMESAFP